MFTYSQTQEEKMPDTLPENPTAKEALAALKTLFIEEHGSLAVAIVWRYLDKQKEKEPLLDVLLECADNLVKVLDIDSEQWFQRDNLIDAIENIKK